MNANAGSAGRGDPLAILWTLCVLAIVAGLGVVWTRGLELETSVLAMLPESEQDPALDELSRQISGRSARALLILVGHERREPALAAAAFVEAELSRSRSFASVAGALDERRERAFHDLYFPLRYALLAPRMRAELAAGAGPRELLQRLREKLVSPLSAVYTRTLEHDPLLLYSACVESWASQRIGGVAEQGFLLIERDHRAHAVLAAETAADPFDAEGQGAALEEIETLRTEVAARFEGARIVFTGIPRFAAQARAAIRRDVAIIGLGSMLGTALCILLAFRSPRPFVLSFLPVGVGIAAATLVSLLVFRRLHALTLVFGTSLTGLGVDYALHYFAAWHRGGAGWNARRAMRAMLPGITLGVVTSVIGFSGLYFTPFPVLRQFALFSSVGLVAAWATVVCWFPALLARAQPELPQPWLLRRGQAFLDFAARLQRRAFAPLVLAIACAGVLALLARLSFQDDVRKYHAGPPALLAEDQLVRDLAGRTDDNRFVLVEGASEQETLERLEHAALGLRAAVEAGELESFRDLALFLPSIARQRADHALLGSRLLPRFDELAAGLDELGFGAEAIEELRQALATEPREMLDVARWLASPASEFLRSLWLGGTTQGFGATLLLGGIRDPDAVERRVAGVAGVHYVDRIRDLSELLRRHRVDTTRLVVIAYAGVLLALIARFGVRGGLRAMLPSLLSAGTTLVLLAGLGVELDLFHLLGLLLVLGLAVDYGVFLAEDALAEATTLFALALSVITTVIAFGLMVTSSAPPLQALGSSVSLGIVLALLFSPIARPRPSAKNASNR